MFYVRSVLDRYLYVNTCDWWVRSGFNENTMAGTWYSSKEKNHERPSVPWITTYTLLHTHTHKYKHTLDSPVTKRHLTGSLIELRESCPLIARLKVSLYLYSLVLLIAPKRQLDTVKWGDKQILGLLIEGDGKTMINKQREGIREANPDTNT